MKSKCTAFLLSFFLFTSILAYAQVQPVKQTANLKMRGAYTMLKQTLDSGTGPSVQPVEQLKIYTDKYIMYAHRRSETDSLAEYGIGTYSVENGKVIEKMFYSASGPVSDKYELAINKDPEGYSQVIDFPGSSPDKHYILTEEYKQHAKRMVSPMDGTWKQVSVVNIDKDGKATTDDNPVQFKIYESGNYMWANTSKDKEGKLVSFYGYGSFAMPTPNQVTETTTSSSFTTALVGQPVKLTIKFFGKDRYEQTISWPDGSKMIETYQRMF